MSRVAILIPAGGAGRRMGGAFKPFLEIDGEPMLAHTLRPFLERDDIEWVVVALPPEMVTEPPVWLCADPRVAVVSGGAERGDSVRNALAAVPPEADVILVHDAARPLVTADVIDRCIVLAGEGRSAIAAIRAVDTIKEVDDGGRVAATPDRRRLWAAQTPQAFPAAVLRNALARALEERVASTDDSALVDRFGGTVVVVEGHPENLKVTTVADLAIAEVLLRQRRTVVAP